jgi:iron complex outermembrane recepter protein
LSGVRVRGGELDYNATPYNLGGTFEMTDAMQVFGGFSQGFSIPDIGSPLRNAAFTNVEGLRPGAAVADNWELGLRGNWSAFSFTAAWFLSKSDLGTDFVINPVAPTEALTLREKERIQGIELTVEGTLTEQWRWGGNYSRSEGKRDANKDGAVETPLTGRRISPALFNAYTEYDLTPTWLLRLQVAWSGKRDKFNNPVGNFYTGDVQSTTRVDALTSFKLHDADVSLGVANLLNKDYFPLSSQMLNRNDRYSKAEGRTLFLRVGYAY